MLEQSSITVAQCVALKTSNPSKLLIKKEHMKLMKNSDLTEPPWVKNTHPVYAEVREVRQPVQLSTDRVRTELNS